MAVERLKVARREGIAVGLGQQSPRESVRLIRSGGLGSTTPREDEVIAKLVGQPCSVERSEHSRNYSPWQSWKVMK